MSEGVDKLKDAGSKVWNKADQLKDRVEDKASEGLDKVKSAGQSVWRKAERAVDKVEDKVTSLVNCLCYVDLLTLSGGNVGGGGS